jgi:hypothetical protein
MAQPTAPGPTPVPPPRRKRRLEMTSATSRTAAATMPDHNPLIVLCSTAPAALTAADETARPVDVHVASISDEGSSAPLGTTTASASPTTMQTLEVSASEPAIVALNIVTESTGPLYIVTRPDVYSVGDGTTSVRAILAAADFVNPEISTRPLTEANVNALVEMTAKQFPGLPLTWIRTIIMDRWNLAFGRSFGMESVTSQAPDPYEGPFPLPVASDEPVAPSPSSGGPAVLP